MIYDEDKIFYSFENEYVRFDPYLLKIWVKQNLG